MSREVLVNELWKCSTDVGFHVDTMWLIEAYDFSVMISLKPLILSASLYADTALSKYSLLQDISEILQLTIDGICLVIVGGWFDCLLMQSYLFCMDNIYQFLDQMLHPKCLQFVNYILQ